MSLQALTPRAACYSDLTRIEGIAITLVQSDLVPTTLQRKDNTAHLGDGHNITAISQGKDNTVHCGIGQYDKPPPICRVNETVVSYHPPKNGNHDGSHNSEVSKASKGHDLDAKELWTKPS